MVENKTDRPKTDKIEVTREMIDAGETYVWEKAGGWPSFGALTAEFLAGLYRAMASASPCDTQSHEDRR